MEIRKWVFRLKRLNPCSEAAETCNAFKTPKEAWENWPEEKTLDMLWLLDQIDAEEIKIIRARIMADIAERVLPIYEREVANDDRPRRAIESVRAWAERPCEETAAAKDAARDVAWAAARDAEGAARAVAWAAARAAEGAAWAAAWAAARAAARDAELKAQKEIVLRHCPFELLDKHIPKEIKE